MKIWEDIEENLHNQDVIVHRQIVEVLLKSLAAGCRQQVHLAYLDSNILRDIDE